MWARATLGTNGGYNFPSVATTMNRMTVDVYGNVYLTGYYYGSSPTVTVVDFDPGIGVFNLPVSPSNVNFIQKLDINGNFLWAQTYGSVIWDIWTDASGNVYTTGGYNGVTDFDPGVGVFNSPSGAGAVLRKLDASGNFILAKFIPGAFTSAGGAAVSMTIDPAGNIYLEGYFSGTVDFNPGVGTMNLTSVGNYDSYILKLNSACNFIWVKTTIGTNVGSNSIQLTDIASDALGNVYSTGLIYGTVDFDPGAGVSNLSGGTQSDAFFVRKLDTNGNFSWVRKIGGTSSVHDFSTAITVANFNIYMTGTFGGTEDFNPTTTTSNLTSLGGDDIFVLKWNDCKPGPYNTSFTYSTCVGGTSLLEVTGPTQPVGTNPYYVYYLIEYFPGTSNPEVLIETINYWQQPSPYIYSAGPFTFTTPLQAGKHYYVKFGVWSDCSPWQESRIYNITVDAAPNPEFYLARLPNYPPYTTWQICDAISLVETYEANNGLNYNNYHIDLWERNCGTNAIFAWKSTLGWTAGTLPASLDIKTLFINNGVVFTPGKEYQVKLALGNDCDGWEDATYNFCVIACALPKIDADNNSTIDALELDEEYSITLYPNPTQLMLNIKVEALNVLGVRVLSSLGQTLWQINGMVDYIEVGDLPSGMYFVEFKTDKGLLHRQFIKK